MSISVYLAFILNNDKSHIFFHISKKIVSYQLIALFIFTKTINSKIQQIKNEMSQMITEGRSNSIKTQDFYEYLQKPFV